MKRRLMSSIFSSLLGDSGHLEDDVSRELVLADVLDEHIDQIEEAHEDGMVQLPQLFLAVDVLGGVESLDTLDR